VNTEFMIAVVTKKTMIMVAILWRLRTWHFCEDYNHSRSPHK